MKLIVTGPTGRVGSEVIRQSLKNSNITSIVTLGRRAVSASDVGEGADTSKLKNMVVEDFTNIPTDVKAEMVDADACIWYF
jgi:dihydrodipicolinate reductase